MALFVSDESSLPNLSFFGDASSLQREFMVAGGFAVSGHRLAEIEAHITALRESAGIQSEFHWAAYRGGNKRAAYEELVDYAFGLVRAKHAALHIIIAKFGGYDHNATPGENKATSVNRMYFQLLLHRVARYYGKKRAIHVRLDSGNDSADICDMRNQLCAEVYSRYGARPNCVRSIEPVCSVKAPIVQMADVIVGAIAAKRNKVEHSSAKGPLADYVLKASGRRSWDSNTLFYARFFTVWNHQTKG
jgi:hypothetical protein